MKVSEFMTADPIYCLPTATVDEAGILMGKHNVSALPVVDQAGHLVGIVTASDFVGKEVDIPHALVSVKRLLGETYHHLSVEDIWERVKDREVLKIMTPRPHCINSDRSLDAVVDLMVRKDLKRLPVVDGKKLVGIVTRKNIVRAFHALKGGGPPPTALF